VAADDDIGECSPKVSPRFRPYDEALRERLQLLSFAFYRCHAAFTASLDAHEADGGRVEGAPAHLDQQRLASREPPYPPSVHALIEFHSYCYLSVVGEHMRALGALYDKQEILNSPPVLIRSVLEHSARVVWLLEDDQQPEDRAARVYLDLLLSTVERKKTSGRFFGKDSEQYRGATELLAHVRNEAETIFGEPVVDDQGQHRIRGQRMPGLEECVATLLARTGAHAGAHRSAYARMSNLAHPTVYPHVEMLNMKIEDGEKILEHAVAGEDHQQHAALAIAAFSEALNHVISYQGWPRGQYEQLSGTIEQLLWAPTKT
jgi:hypothetical protein